MATSPMAGKYDEKLDRNSAAEMLAAKADAAAKAAEEAEAEEEKLEAEEREFKAARSYSGREVERSSSRGRKSGGGFGSALASVVAKELKGTTGRRIVRGILGGLFKGR
jgi:hypothetical protein